MFTWIKTAWSWIKGLWAKFEAWVASWAPGLKTKLISALGMLGSTAGVLQEYITGIPMDRFVSGTTVAITAAVLFTLAFWLRGLGDRVTARAV